MNDIHVSISTEQDQLQVGMRANRCLLVSEPDPSSNIPTKLLGAHTHFRHMGWALLTLLKVATVDGISKTLERLDTTPKLRFPDQATAIDGAVKALKQLPTALTQDTRRALLLPARNHLSGCVTAYELDQLQVVHHLSVKSLKSCHVFALRVRVIISILHVRAVK